MDKVKFCVRQLLKKFTLSIFEYLDPYTAQKFWPGFEGSVFRVTFN